MSKHTPGPWNYDCGYIDTQRVEDDGSSDYVILAEMRSTFGYDDYGVYKWILPPEEYKANGRLIAAAPEMLELLAEIRDQHLIPRCGRDDCDSCDDKIFAAQIDALMERIEGGGNE